METTPRWIKQKEISQMTGRAKQNLANERCKGKRIPYSKIGTSIRYRLDDVISFMESCMVTPVEQ